jgi:hypothetical protein
MPRQSQNQNQNQMNDGDEISQQGPRRMTDLTRASLGQCSILHDCIAGRQVIDDFCGISIWVFIVGFLLAFYKGHDGDCVALLIPIPARMDCSTGRTTRTHTHTHTLYD